MRIDDLLDKAEMAFTLKEKMTVTMIPNGNFRRNWDGKPRHGVVEKIGRKYAHIRLLDGARSVYRFDKETHRCVESSEQNAGYEIFQDDESCQNEMKRRFMAREIMKWINRGALDSLRYEVVHHIYHTIQGEMKEDQV